jgi:hypothetical protein
MKVPSYDNFQATPSTQQGPAFQAPGGPSGAQIGAGQMAQAGAAVQGFGGIAAKIALSMQDEVNQTRIADAMNQAVAEKLRLTYDTGAGFKALQGRQALERPDGKALPDEYGEALGKRLSGIREGLGNDEQKRIFGQLSQQLHTQFIGDVTQHMLGAQKEFRISTQVGTVKLSADQMAIDPFNIDQVEQGRNAIKAATAEIGRIQGLSPVETTAKMIEALSPAHMAVLQSAIQQGKLDFANAYRNQVNAELTPDARLRLDEALKVGTTAARAQQLGAQVASMYDYLHTADAQKTIDAMDVTPAEKTAIRAEVEHRHAVQQSDTDKTQAFVVGKLHEMVFSGQSQASILRTPEYAAARDKGAVLEMIRNKEYQDTLRAQANDARGLAALQRHQTEMHIKQAGSAMAYMDPVVLAGTPREKIQALLPTLGIQWTQELLTKKDAIVKTGLKEATMDFDDIKAVAKDYFGIDPANLKTPEQKAAFVDFKSRAERLIAAEPSGREMSRSEKYSKLAEEAARTVTINPGMFSFNKDVPVILVGQKQIDEVQVPAKDRERISEIMRKNYQATGNPDFAPTVDNLRRWHLVDKGAKPAEVFTKKKDKP